MKRILLLVGALALGAGAAAAQNVSRPDCIIDITLTAAGQSAGGAGTCGTNINGVYEWRLNYKSIGFTAVSLIVQSAPPDVSGGCAAATWVAFAGTVVGLNPNTATTQASSNFVGFYPCVRVFLTSVMGSGTITGQLYGCREPGCSISGATVTAIVAIPNPLPVDGPTAEGSAPTTPPVLVAGQDGAPGVIRVLKTDGAGSLIPSNSSSADSDGINNTEATQTGAAGGILYPRVFARVFNGTTWDRMRGTAAGVFVQGPVADGVASTANPAIVGGVDQNGVARHFSTSPAGDIAVGSQSAAADGQANNWNFLVGGNGSTTAPLATFPAVFNGATWDRLRGTVNGLFSQGSVASGGANAGNPLKIGAPFNTTQPTFTNGQIGDAQLSARGAQIVVPGVEGFPVTVTSNAPTPTGAATAQADGATNSPTVPTVGAGPTAETVPNYPYKFNGSTWDRDFVCTSSAPITFSAASGSLQIVGLVGGQIVRVCHLSISSNTATNFTIQYGTGSNCGVGTNPLSGAYNNVTTLALDFFGTLRTPASQELCINSSVSITAGGIVTYAQF